MASKGNGKWQNLSDWDLIHYVRSNHYGNTISDFIKLSGSKCYDSCRKRVIKNEEGIRISIKNFLVEEGTLIRKNPIGKWKNMSDEDLIHYVRSNHYGANLSDFQNSKDSEGKGGYWECKKRIIKNKDGKTISITDFLIEEGTLIDKYEERSDWQGISNWDLIHYVRSNHYGDTLTEFQKSKNATQGYLECCKRDIQTENGRKISIKDFLIEEGTLIVKQRKGYFKDWDNFARDFIKIIEEIGHFPTYSEIRQKSSTLEHAIFKYHGGMDVVKARMGYGLFLGRKNTISLLESLLEEDKDKTEGERK